MRLGGAPKAFHMSACLATMRSSTFSPVPPIMIGGCGFCTGFGRPIASVTV